MICFCNPCRTQDQNKTVRMVGLYDPFSIFFFHFIFYYVTNTVKAANSPEASSESGGSANGPRNGSAGSSTPLPPVSQNVPVMPKTAAGAPTSAPIPGMNRKVYQDEREVKRQRRKQTNREAAERSRLRKQVLFRTVNHVRVRKLWTFLLCFQAEFDELAKHTEVLNAENASLRAEMNRLKRQREELTSENNSLKV